MRQVYDQIAESWYNLRHWPRFREELGEMARRWQGGRLLNVGCAHGPDFLPFREGFELWGVDFSPKMIRFGEKFSQKSGFKANLAVGEATFLPYPDDAFDWAIAVATYHHIEGEGERGRAFRELRRVLRPGGEAFITVWNRGQPRFWFSPKEVQIPWKAKGEVFYRYYYLFSYPELTSLLKKVGFEVIRAFPERAYRFPIKAFSRNICVLVRK